MNGLFPLRKIAWFIFSLLLLIQANPSFSQTIIGVGDYMRVANEQEYIELEKKWRKIHQERFERGIIKGWAVYRVMFKTPDDPYNFVTVSWYDSFSKLDNPIADEIIQAAYPEMSKDDVKAFHKETESIRRRVSAGVFHQRMTTANGLDKAGTFYVINEVKVKQGKSKELLKIYEEIYKPLYEEDIRNENRTLWSLWEKWPGDMKDFQYLAADGYSSLEQIDQVNYMAYFNKIHPGKNVEEISDRVEELRELVSTEMWKLMFRVN